MTSIGQTGSEESCSPGSVDIQHKPLERSARYRVTWPLLCSTIAHQQVPDSWVVPIFDLLVQLLDWHTKSSTQSPEQLCSMQTLAGYYRLHSGHLVISLA
jgi:hypothetical protein